MPDSTAMRVPSPVLTAEIKKSVNTRCAACQMKPASLACCQIQRAWQVPVRASSFISRALYLVSKSV